MQLSIKYRPTKFSEVAGQPVATRILANSIKMNRVPNALILFGLHGCGKTSLARIYAKALNCEGFDGEPCGVCQSCLDIQAGTSRAVLEYDAASHSGVDSAREFEELLSFESDSKYKVLILDECHMLTKQAQSVLLKLIEDPPKNAVFILVTTDVRKLESTVTSRCLKVDLRPVSKADMVTNLTSILDREGHTYTPGLIDRLTQYSTGSLRDTQQILESLIIRGDGQLTEDLLEDVLGLIPTKVYRDMAYAFNSRSTRVFFDLITEWYTQGIDLVYLFTDGVPKLLRDFMVVFSGADLVFYSGIARETLVRNLVLTYDEVKAMLRQWEIDMEFMTDTDFPKIIWETYAVNICTDAG